MENETGKNTAPEKGTASDPGASQEELVKQLTQAAKSAEGRASGAEKKSQKLQGDLSSMKERLEEAEGRLVEAEREKIQALSDEPDALRRWQAEQDIRKAKTEIARDKAAIASQQDEIKEQLEDIQKFRREKIVADIAAKYNVDSALLADLDLLPEKLEALAKVLPKKGQEPVQPSLKPDSGMTVGAGELTIEQVRKMSPEERAARAKEIAKLPLGMEL